MGLPSFCIWSVEMKNIVFAIDGNGNFGNHDGSLPWPLHNKVDMDNFKQVTKQTGVVVCGYNTALTIPNGLKDRECWLLSNKPVCASLSAYKALTDDLPYEQYDYLLPDSYTLIGGMKTIEKALISGVKFDEVYMTVFSDTNPKCDVVVSGDVLDILELRFSYNVHYRDDDLIIYKYTNLL